MLISTRNRRIFLVSQFLYALVFTIPVWIVYYQGRISVSQISFLVSLSYAAQLIFELPTGALADIFGRKWTIAIGYFIWTISSLLIVFSTGFSPIVVATLLAGLAESLISGSLEALVYDSYKQDGNEKEFGKVLATNGMIFQFGLAAATFLGGFLFQLWVGLPWVLYAVMCLLAAILSLFFIEPKIDSERFSLYGYIRQIRMGTKEAFKSKYVTIVSLFYIAVSAITWSNNLYFFDFMLVDLHFNDGERSIIGGVIRIINVTILRTLLKNDHIFTRNVSVLFFPVVMLICFLPGAFFESVWALPFIAGAVMAGTARWIILAQYTNENFDSKYRATAISALSMFVGVLFVCITLASGPLIERFNVKLMYSALGLLTLVTVVPLSVLFLRTKSK